MHYKLFLPIVIFILLFCIFHKTEYESFYNKKNKNKNKKINTYDNKHSIKFSSHPSKGGGNKSGGLNEPDKNKSHHHSPGGKKNKSGTLDDPDKNKSHHHNAETLKHNNHHGIHNNHHGIHNNHHGKHNNHHGIPNNHHGIHNNHHGKHNNHHGIHNNHHGKHNNHHHKQSQKFDIYHHHTHHFSQPTNSCIQKHMVNNIPNSKDNTEWKKLCNNDNNCNWFEDKINPMVKENGYCSSNKPNNNGKCKSYKTKSECSIYNCQWNPGYCAGEGCMEQYRDEESCNGDKKCMWWSDENGLCAGINIFPNSYKTVQSMPDLKSPQGTYLALPINNWECS